MSTFGFEDESVRTVANNLKAQIEEFNTLLNSIKAENNTLAEIWKGDDIKKYTDAVAVQMNSLQEIKNTFDNITVFLDKAVSTVSQTREENASQINF